MKFLSADTSKETPVVANKSCIELAPCSKIQRFAGTTANSFLETFRAFAKSPPNGKSGEQSSNLAGDKKISQRWKNGDVGRSRSSSRRGFLRRFRSGR